MTKEEKREYNRRYYEARKERFRAEALARYHAKADAGVIDRASQAAYYKKWRAENPDKAKKTPEQAKRHQEMATARYRSIPSVRAAKLLNCKRWTAANSAKVSHMNYRRKYGVSAETIERLAASQNNACAICGASSHAPNTKDVRRFLHVDHCHSTKVVRGLLCQKCNRGIGLFNDSPDRLRAAADYLDRVKKT